MIIQRMLKSLSYARDKRSRLGGAGMAGVWGGGGVEEEEEEQGRGDGGQGGGGGRGLGKVRKGGGRGEEDQGRGTYVCVEGGGGGGGRERGGGRIGKGRGWSGNAEKDTCGFHILRLIQPLCGLRRLLLSKLFMTYCLHDGFTTMRTTVYDNEYEHHTSHHPGQRKEKERTSHVGEGLIENKTTPISTRTRRDISVSTLKCLSAQNSV